MPAPARLEPRGAGVFALSGELNFDSVAALAHTAPATFGNQALDLKIDLAGVGRSDSAGVALLVDWLRLARARGQTIRFVNIPKQMRAIIRVAELATLLPLES